MKILIAIKDFIILIALGIAVELVRQLLSKEAKKELIKQITFKIEANNK